MASARRGTRQFHAAATVIAWVHVAFAMTTAASGLWMARAAAHDGDAPVGVEVWYGALGIAGAVVLVLVAGVLLRARRAAPPLLPRLAGAARTLYWAAGGVIAVALITMGVGARLSMFVVVPVIAALGSAPVTSGYFKAWAADDAGAASGR